MIRIKNTVALTACSDPVRRAEEPTIQTLKKILEGMGLSVLISPILYGTMEDRPLGWEKAAVLLEYYRNPKVEAILDVSGGNLANELLPYLDFETISKNPKPFFGYSDLTVLLNTIQKKTGQSTVLYSVRNLVREKKEEQQAAFRETFLEGGRSLLDVPMEYFQGDRLRGEIAGGNIRCLLKLAGTPFFPELDGKVLFLESLSGSRALHISQFFQLMEMGVFEKISGLVLGTFTGLEKEEGPYAIREVLKAVLLPEALPVAKTWAIGHGPDSKALVIGDSMWRKK